MATREEVTQAFTAAMRRMIYEQELPAYMGRDNGAGGYEYDTSDGRKWVRVPNGNGEVDQMCDLLDDNITDDDTQAVWIKFVKEGRWAITRKRIEGY